MKPFWKVFAWSALRPSWRPFAVSAEEDGSAPIRYRREADGDVCLWLKERAKWTPGENNVPAGQADIYQGLGFSAPSACSVSSTFFSSSGSVASSARPQ